LSCCFSDIGEDVFRGFALADNVAPFVVINDNDAIAARPFTLMHELVHIWLGESGVSGPLRNVPENVVEQFCNNTASEFLLPPGSIPDLSNLQDASFDDVSRAVQSLAAVWKVSEPAVAYRLSSAGASKNCGTKRPATGMIRPDRHITSFVGTGWGRGYSMSCVAPCKMKLYRTHAQRKSSVSVLPRFRHCYEIERPAGDDALSP
jgi:hypothetical protein